MTSVVIRLPGTLEHRTDLSAKRNRVCVHMPMMRNSAQATSWPWLNCTCLFVWNRLSFNNFLSNTRAAGAGTVTGYRLDGWVRFQAEQETFLYPAASRPAMTPAHSACHTVEYWELRSSGAKRPGCEADQSSRSSIEVKNGESLPTLLNTSFWRRA
jgi:hypothetical protein